MRKTPISVDFYKEPENQDNIDDVVEIGNQKYNMHITKTNTFDRRFYKNTFPDNLTQKFLSPEKIRRNNLLGNND